MSERGRERERQRVREMERKGERGMEGGKRASEVPNGSSFNSVFLS